MLKVMDPLQLMQKTEIFFDDILRFKSFLKTLKLVGFVFFVYESYIYSCMFVYEHEILCCHFFSYEMHSNKTGIWQSLVVFIN
jgi:hypothetical protein